MNLAVTILVLAIAAPIVIGILIARRSSASLLEKLSTVLPFPVIGFVFWLTCVATISGSTTDWSGAKLAPIVAMVRGMPHGYRLYQDPYSGVLSGWVYGPVPAIIFLPAAIWSTPTPALVTAMVINVLCILIPTIWIIFQELHRVKSREWPLALAVICFFVLSGMNHTGLLFVMFNIGADAPAIGFAACSCAVLIGGYGWTRLALTALFAVLAVWSKQTLAPFLMVAPLYLWLIRQPRHAFQYLVILMVTGAVVSLLLIVLFGPLSSMWFHMVTLVSTNPWQQGSTAVADAEPLLVAWMHGLIVLLKQCAESLAILLGLAVIARLTARKTFVWRGMRQWAVDTPYIMPAISAIVLAPAAVLGFSIVGGYSNHIALCNYFLTLSAALGIMFFVIRLDDNRLRLLARYSIIAFIVFRALQFAFAPGEMRKMLELVANPTDNVQERIYKLLKDRGHLIYFPWQPLPAVLAEGKLYHFEWGAIDRNLAGLPVDPDQLQDHLPEGVQYMAFRFDAQSRFMLQYFPQATREVRPVELPGFLLFTEPQALNLPTSPPIWVVGHP